MYTVHGAASYRGLNKDISGTSAHGGDLSVRGHGYDGGVIGIDLILFPYSLSNKLQIVPMLCLERSAFPERINL